LRPGLTVLIPSRSRPLRFKETAESLLKTAKFAEILAYLDDDDPERDAYEQFERVKYYYGPRIKSAPASKFLMGKAETEYMMFAADDIVFRTPNWDEELVNAIPKDGVGLAFGNDGWKGAASHYVFHRKWFELTGIFPDVFNHFGPDGYGVRVMETVNRKRIKSLQHVKIEHMHFRIHKAPFDKTYEEERKWGDGRQSLEDALRDRLHKDVAILRAEIERCSSTP
jgi:hypothetical protein